MSFRGGSLRKDIINPRMVPLRSHGTAGLYVNGAGLLLSNLVVRQLGSGFVLHGGFF